MNRRFPLLFFLALLLSGSSFPQIQDKEDFKSFLGDALTAPAHFDSKDFFPLGVSLAAISGSYFLDHQIKTLSQNNRTPTADKIFAADKYFVEIAASLTALTYFYGLAAENYKTRRLGLKLAEAFLLQATAMVSLKFLVGRERPASGTSNDSFNPFNTSWAFTSFPSGHTSTAFALASVIANDTDQIGWKITAWSLASAIGFSRIYNNEHWLSDVVAGALIGYFAGEFVSAHKSNTQSPPVQITPIPLSVSIPLN